MEIWIVRHADPDYAHDSITEKGEREAELLAQLLAKTDFDAVYCSPMGRAQKTASYYLNRTGKTAETLSWLHEFEGTVNLGGEQVMCWDRKPAYWTQIDDYYSYEKWFDVALMRQGDVRRHYEKVAAGIDALLARHGYVHDGRLYRAEHANADRLLLFCHFGVESVILSQILHVSPMILWHNFVALPTSVTRLASVEREQGTVIFNIIQYGDLSHLYAGGEAPSFAARFCEQFTDDTRH